MKYQRMKIFFVVVCFFAVIQSRTKAQLRQYHYRIGIDWQYAVIQKSLLWSLPALGLHGPI
jgi:hypothetical protein